ncbi:hypothetical protein X801_04780 [Opisthorchis viverrini]|uniref:Protein kinase domain-containing protein n=1 Tax=Opisthorchis viverrini TaxID=6198 RepID=A0A1S8WYA7_OPIVI|nr:hypothetical protein X801_04780 [Opisthorchis viverrini]
MIEDLASRKIKIIDFGLARVLHPNQTFQDMAGTPEFCVLCYEVFLRFLLVSKEEAHKFKIT